MAAPKSRQKKKRSFLGRLFHFFQTLALIGLVGAALLVIAGFAAYLYFERGLPSADALRSYRPPQVTKVYCSDGSVCAEFFFERRTLVSIETLPPHVKNAFLAAEDADFYKH